MIRGKVALVTGASRGIGKGTAIALAKEGVKVYITGRVISQIVLDKEKLLLSGKKFTSAELAIKYNIQDIDGKQPQPLTVENC